MEIKSTARMRKIKDKNKNENHALRIETWRTKTIVNKREWKKELENKQNNNSG